MEPVFQKISVEYKQDSIEMTYSSGSTEQFKQIIRVYSRFAPKWTFTPVGFLLAGAVVFVAWFGGRVLFPTFTLIPRIFALWSIALLEYFILIPTIGASVEVLDIPESSLAVLIHSAQLFMFFVLNGFVLHSPFTANHGVAFLLMISAIFLVAFPEYSVASVFSG